MKLPDCVLTVTVADLEAAVSGRLPEDMKMAFDQMITLSTSLKRALACDFTINPPPITTPEDFPLEQFAVEYQQLLLKAAKAGHDVDDIGETADNILAADWEKEDAKSHVVDRKKDKIDVVDPEEE